MWWPTSAFEPRAWGTYDRFGAKVGQSGHQSAQTMQHTMPECNQALAAPHYVSCSCQFHFPHALACWSTPHCECACPAHNCGQSGTSPLSGTNDTLQMLAPHAPTAGGHTWESEWGPKGWPRGSGWHVGRWILAVPHFGAPTCIMFQPGREMAHHPLHRPTPRPSPRPGWVPIRCQLGWVCTWRQTRGAPTECAGRGACIKHASASAISHGPCF